MNTPQAWNRLRAKVQKATVTLTGDQLTNRTAELQRRWNQHQRSATWEVLQELYTEQHRRRWC